MMEPADDTDDIAGEDMAEVVEEVPRATRGLLWIIGPTVLGLALGALIGYFRGKAATIDPQEVMAEWVEGSIVGTLIGCGVGAFIWAFFPYQRSEPPQE